jgi:hypothetical protein
MNVIKFGVALYDTSITDLKERKDKRIEFDTAKKACAKLGISDNVLRRVIANREKIYIENYKKEFAIRHIKSE